MGEQTGPAGSPHLDSGERFRRPRVGRLGLRARSVVATAFGALVVSVGMASLTFALVREELLDQRDQAVRRQTFANARLLRAFLQPPQGPDLNLLGSLRSEPGAVPLLWYLDTWWGNTVALGRDDLPAELRLAAQTGESGVQRFRLAGRHYSAVAVGIPSLRAAYFEVFPLDATDRTLRAVRASLALASGVTAVGGAALGLYTSRRVMRPLRRVSAAAESLARGGLDTRLPKERDRDLARLVGSFNGMADALEARIHREARFASDVSHELRTPLAALTASAQVLEGRRDDLPDRSRQALDILTNQLRRFDRMILDLLELSRIDADATDLQAEPERIALLAPRIARAFGFGDVPIDVAPALAEAYVHIDRRRLERILVNLLENARVHAGGAVGVQIDRPRPGWVRIAVDDAGPGVAAQDRDRIFERFTRGTGTRHRQGTGLGLALVAEHARALRGSVRVEPREPQGARFVVEFPA